MTATKDNPYLQSVIPTLIVDGASDAIALYEKAFGAKELARLEWPDGSGKLMWAMMIMGNTKLFVMDTNENVPQSTNASLYVYFDNVDAIFAQAKSAGMIEQMAPMEMFYGDKMGNLTDRFGIRWSVATHVRDVSDEEMKQAVKEMCSGKAA